MLNVMDYHFTSIRPPANDANGLKIDKWGPSVFLNNYKLQLYPSDAWYMVW